MLCLSHTEVCLALYKLIIWEEVQCSFLAAHQTIFGNDVPIIDSEVRLMMKHRWSPTPPYCERMKTLTQVIPGVVNVPLMGALPFWWVGGIGVPVWFLVGRGDWCPSMVSAQFHEI
jgi:hypothetical protein